MVAWLSTWEDNEILPRLLSNDKKEILMGCNLLIEDDTGDVDEVKVTLAKLLAESYGK